MSDCCPICDRPLCRTALGESTDYEQRAKCCRIGYMKQRDAANNLAHVAAEQAAIIREVRDRGDAELANALLRANGRESARREKAENENARLRDELNEQREAKEAAYERIYKALALLDEPCLWSVRVVQARAVLGQIAAPRPADVLSSADEIGDESARTDEPF